MTVVKTQQDIPHDPRRRRLWIIFQLQSKGKSLSSLAGDEGVSQQAISASAAGNGSSHLQEALAAAIGVTARDLFPEHFDSNGDRLRKPRKPQRKSLQKT